METPVTGQRWVSKTEADLGLGVVLKVEYGRIEIFFPASNELRQYALSTAPLQRVRFKEGDSILTHTGESFTITTVSDEAGLIIYRCGTVNVPEAQLADTISFSKPEDRLLAGQIDDIRASDLRAEGLKWRADMQRSSVRGFVGGRVDLLPHQMFIANEVSNRVTPRVLLADEVGLGKTIEAGLILHRLHLTDRANRVLILLPDALVNQWFVELLRRFNLVTSVLDEDRCLDLASDDPEGNPFKSCQIALCSISFLVNDENRADQAVAAGWDLMIVDEAHHLEWTPETVSPAYALVEKLAAHTSGLLLLTATPQQLGPEGHFARLRLLDPERYDSLEKFQEEAEHYAETAAVVERLLAGEKMTKTDQSLFSKKSERVKKLSAALTETDEGTRQLLISCLLDEFGTGRVMFRNTRAALKGFPERKALLAPLKPGEDEDTVKIKWLAGLLRDLGTSKVLLICRTREQAETIHEMLLHELNVSCSLFHEEMTLVQRDRAAVHFADEEGARILLCSEIGSEGRNFQFAHHLVLYDLPLNPELLEQRIGRLDRIGQTATIQIHVPYIKGTEGEVLARWYQEGINAFEKHPHGAMDILIQMRADLAALAKNFSTKKLDTLISKTQKALALVEAKLEKGHDRLLEMTSFKPDQAQSVIDAVHALDDELDFEDFVIRLMDRIGVTVEEHGHRSYVFRPGDLMSDALPALPPEGMFVTFDRERALSRENIGFLTIDHPTVRGAMDHLLGSELGNTSFGVWKGSGGEGILLDLHYVVDCIAPAALHVSRFLPSTPIRVIIDHAMTDLSEDDDTQTAGLIKGDSSKLLDNGAFRKKLMPAMMKKALGIANTKMSALIAEALAQIDTQLNAEIERLEDLARINNHVSPEEAKSLRESQNELQRVVSGSKLRLDVMRLVIKTK